MRASFPTTLCRLCANVVLVEFYIGFVIHDRSASEL